MSIIETSKIKIQLANPTGLGLFGLAIVTLVAASQKLHITEGLSYVIVYAIFLGATAQLLASIFDFLHDNIWGATVFGAYAFFWYAIATCWMMKMGVFGPILAAATDVGQIGFAFLGYLIFSVFMTIGALEVNKMIFTIMVMIDVLLAALTLNAFGVAPALTGTIAGISEMIVSLLSFYACAAVVLNTHFGKAFMPMGKPFGIFKK
ncbi:MAG: acetate uptake transporter [Sporomusaceae bacterium]|nr:acetate uptake transporter [Sporomusaceae bacterium]